MKLVITGRWNTVTHPSPLWKKHNSVWKILYFRIAPLPSIDVLWKSLEKSPVAEGRAMNTRMFWIKRNTLEATATYPFSYFFIQSAHSISPMLHFKSQSCLASSMGHFLPLMSGSINRWSTWVAQSSFCKLWSFNHMLRITSMLK